MVTYVCRWIQQWRTDLHNVHGTEQLTVLALLIYCGEELLSWMLFLKKKGYLLVCTSIKLTVHHIYFICTSPVMYEVEDLALFHIFMHLLMRLHPILLSPHVKSEEMEEKKNWQNKAQTHENAFCARLLIRSKKTTNTVSSPHQARKSGWWHTPWIAGWPGVTQIWSDTGFPLMHDNGLHTVL